MASVALIQALGGGWDTSHLPNKDDLQRGLPFLPDALDPTLPKSPTSPDEQSHL